MATHSREDVMIQIHGIVADFAGNPIPGASVVLNDRNFDALASAISDDKGRYSIVVKEGLYIAMTSIREEDYAVRKLEYWAWNVPAYYGASGNRVADFIG
jgi:hypothetical protein